MHSDIRPLIVYTRNNSVDANVSGRVCTATESPLGTCLTDIMQALECEECVEAWSVTLKRHQTDDVTSQAAWWLVECSGGVLLYSFFYSSISVLPPAFVQPCRVQLTRLHDSFCNEYVQRIPSLYDMMDEDCRKCFTFTANAFPLTYSHDSVCLYFAFQWGLKVLLLAADK